MFRRWWAATALLIGLVVAGLAVCSGTVWRPQDHVTATHKVKPGTQVLVTDPGVLEAQHDSVTVQVVSGAPVVVAVGRENDVNHWVGDSPIERITGFASQEVFDVREAGSAEPVGAAAGSDLWVVSREFDRKGTLKWAKRLEGRWSLVVAPSGTKEGETPNLGGTTVTMTWPQVVTTPFLWPGVILGSALMALGGAFLLSRLVSAKRRSQQVVDDAVSAPQEEKVPALAHSASSGGSSESLESLVPPPSTVPAPMLTPALEPAAEPLEVVPELAVTPEALAADGLISATEGLPESEPKPKKRRRWFRRRTPDGPPPEETGLAATQEPAKLDLGLATPNRNWERLAAPQLHYPQDTGETPAADLGAGFSAGYQPAGLPEAPTPEFTPAPPPLPPLPSLGTAPRPSSPAPDLGAGVPASISGGTVPPLSAPTPGLLDSTGQQPWATQSVYSNQPVAPRPTPPVAPPPVRSSTPVSQSPAVPQTLPGGSSRGTAPSSPEPLPTRRSQTPPPPGLWPSAQTAATAYPQPAPAASAPPPAPRVWPAAQTSARHRPQEESKPSWAAPYTPPPNLATPPQSMWASGQMPQQPAFPTGETGPLPARRPAPVSPAEKIAALRETHTSLADEAAATIAAAVAAAAGSGSAAGLTRRQIREAERAAQYALHASAQRTGEIPPWDTASQPAVEMQTGREGA